jgi:hypothetical protein
METTRRPETHLASPWFLEKVNVMEDNADVARDHQNIIEAFMAGYTDALSGTCIELELLRDCYADKEDLVCAQKIYRVGFDLCLKMTDRQREIFTRVILEESSLAEAGRQTGICLNGVKKHLILIGNKGKKVKRQF